MDGTSCSVCLDLFSSEPPHRPKILLCGHSTCEQCIHQWTNRSNPPLVQCPHCRRQFDGLSLDDVPVNYLVLEMMEISRKRKGQDEDEGKVSNKKQNSNNDNDDDDDIVIISKQCEISNGNCNQTATHRCMECPEGNQLMCKDHLFHHASFQALFVVPHNPIRIEDLPPSLTSSSSVRRTCSDHIGQALTVYCWDCSKAVCDRCALFGHKTHSYSEIHQAADRMKKELEEEKNGMDERMRAMKQISADVETTKSSLESKSTELLRMTDRMFDEIQEALEMMRTVMKKRVIDEKRKSDGEVNVLKEELTAAITRGEEEVKKMEAVLEEKDSVVVVVGEGGELMRKMKEEEKEGRMDEWRKMLQRLEKEFDCAGSIDLDRMNETKMMMERGMKAALASYWGGFKEEDNSSNSNNNDGNDNSSNDTNNNEEKRKTIELAVARRFDVGMLTNQRLQIERHVTTNETVNDIAWSNDGMSLFAVGGKTVQQVHAADGKLIKVICRGRAKSALFIAVGKEGEIYVTDNSEKKINVIYCWLTSVYRQIGSEGAADGQFLGLRSLCVVDEWKELHVCDDINRRIQVFSTVNARFIRTFSTGEDFIPMSISVDASNGLIFVSECRNNRVQVLDREGRSLRIIGSLGSGDGRLKGPHGILAVPASKEVIVCDTDNNRICVFDYDGRFKCSVATIGMEKPIFMSMNKNRRLAISCEGHSGVFFAKLEGE